MLNPCVLAKPGLYKHVAHMSVLLIAVGRNWKGGEDNSDLSFGHRCKLRRVQISRLRPSPLALPRSSHHARGRGGSTGYLPQLRPLARGRGRFVRHLLELWPPRPRKETVLRLAQPPSCVDLGEELAGLDEEHASSSARPDLSEQISSAGSREGARSAATRAHAATATRQEVAHPEEEEEAHGEEEEALRHALAGCCTGLLVRQPNNGFASQA